MFKKILFLLLFSSIIYAQTITVAVAANASYVINTLKKEFNKLHPNTKVRIIIAGSGKLTAQIINGAPFDLFMSADMKYPQELYNQNITITKPIVYAQGGLVFLSTKKQDFSEGINLLEKKNIKKIAIANPKTAPYGKASIEAFKNAKIYSKIKNKFVYGESISQTVSFTLLASDIGIVSKSSLYSSKMSSFKKDINWKELNPNLYTPINQGLVILRKAKDNKEALSFYEFILSSQAKKIFETFGYKTL